MSVTRVTGEASLGSGSYALHFKASARSSPRHRWVAGHSDATNSESFQRFLGADGPDAASVHAEDPPSGDRLSRIWLTRLRHPAEVAIFRAMKAGQSTIASHRRACLSQDDRATVHSQHQGSC